MVNCDLCQGIPFQNLPSEEEDALPHQPSLDALEISAEACSICKLILWAAGCSLASPGGGVAYHPGVTLPSGRKVTCEFIEGNYGGLDLMHGLENGAVFLDPSSAKADLRAPIFIDPCSRFPTGANVRPWLFGNWYRSPFEKKPLLLVGLGVRLGTGPSIEEAEGNSKEKIRFKGTYLRIRTDDGTYIRYLFKKPNRAANTEFVLRLRNVSRHSRKAPYGFSRF
jgi:hypothetical protein